LAALVALTADSLAYRGAVAKVNYDRETRDSDKLAAKVAMILQLRSVAARLSRELPRIISYDMPLEGVMDHMSRNVPEFDEAWQKLVLLSTSSMEQLDKARYFVRANQMALDSPLPVAPDRATPEMLEKMNELKATLHKFLQINGKSFAEVCGDWKYR
jgi:hypothetical protein